MVVPVGIALGSNLGDRDAELDVAVLFLESLSVQGRVRESPRIETAPVECPPGSGPFLNAVVEIEVDSRALSPRDLLKKLQAFEIERGRAVVRPLNSPRPLDLDILYYGDLIVQEPGLIIPHPRMCVRRFVLEPLSHLGPELILPGQTKTVRELLVQVTL